MADAKPWEVEYEDPKPWEVSYEKPEDKSGLAAENLDFFRRTHPELFPVQGPMVEHADSLAPAQPHPTPTPAPTEAIGALPQRPSPFIAIQQQLANQLPVTEQPGMPIEEPLSAYRLEHPQTPLEVLRMPTKMPMPRISEETGSKVAHVINLLKGPRSDEEKLRDLEAEKDVGKLIAGGEHTLAGVVDFMTSPGGIATVLTGGALGTEAAGAQLADRALSSAFAFDMARQMPDQMTAIVDALHRGDKAAATEGLLNAAVSLGVITHAAKANVEAISKPKPAAEAAQPKETDARINETPAEVHGDVLPLAVEGKGQVPVKEGQPRVQPETEGGIPKEEVTPESVSKMTPEEFNNFAGINPTGKGYELAKQIGTEGDRSALDVGEKSVVQELNSAMSKMREAKTPEQQEKIFNEAQIINGKKQYFNEAKRMLSAMDDVESGKTVAEAAKVRGVEEKALSEAVAAKEAPSTEPLDPFESFLNKAIDFTNPGQQFGGAKVSLGLAKLPIWLAQEVAHNSLKVIRAAYRTGKDIGKGIDAGIEWLRGQNIKDFDENEARSWLSNSIKSEGADITGIAQRVREKVSAAGQEALAARGEGISAPDSVERGEQLLRADNDAADKAMTAFERDPNKSVSADAMAVARAKLRQLAQAARAAESTFGISSEQYKKAWKERSDWAARIKAMQTEWHKTGMAQQGEQDIDTGTFTGLREAYTDSTGKDFTPQQAETAKGIASRNGKQQAVVNAAQQQLAKHLRGQRVGGMTEAEKRAFDAANKTVREAAVRRANAETDVRVAQVERDRAVEKVQEDASKKAAAAASKAVRESDVRAAKAENKARVTAAQKKLDAAKIQEAAAKRAEDAANKVVRDMAARRAKAEADARVNPEKRVWEKVQEYLDKGVDGFDDIRTKVATDLGMSVKKVTSLLTQNKRAKFLADDLWRKQESLRRFRAQAQRWLKSTALPNYQRALAAIPRTLFALKVGFHGTVALGTHAPMVFFQPPKWAMYFRDFGKMYRMVASPKYYEMQVQELIRRPNYIRARRAGLVNDPTSYEDYNSPLVSQYIGRLSGMGNRGYSVLKILRQDMFDQHWNSLPKTAQIDSMASAIADGINHATGVVKGAAPKGANIVLFAPRLEASRVMWLAGDPLRAANTFATWKTADIAEKEFAINQVKEKAWVAGTLLGLLALNQGVLSATGSRQKVNIDDPFHSDWLKFKAGGMTISYGNPMITMARLPVRLYKIRESDGGKLKNVIYPDESSYTILGEYARSQMSPFMSLASDLWLKGDWQNRPLPSSTRPVPKRLKAQGVYPYTWSEFWTEQVLPIPAEEAARDVWSKGFGMSNEQTEVARKAMATIAIMSATGARLTDDVETPVRK